MLSRFQSIRWRIALPFIIFYSTTIFLFGFIIASQNIATEQKLLETTALQQSNITTHLVKPIIQNHSDELLFDQLQNDFQNSSSEITYLVLDQNREIITSNNPTFDISNLPLLTTELDNSLGGNPSTMYRTLNNGDGEKLIVAMPIKQGEQVIGSLLAIYPTATVSSLSQQIRIISIILILAGSAIIWLISDYLTRKPFGLIKDLTHTAQVIGNLGHQIPSEKTLDEISQLAIAFNAMSLELSSQIDALRAESTKLETVLQQMTDGVVIVDKHGRIQLFNKSAEEMFFTTENNPAGLSLVEVLRDYRLIDLWEKCVQTDEEQSVYLEFRQPSRILHCIATPMGDNLKGSVLLLFQDLTRIRQLETIRRDFISNISHELRTPIASLKALTETLSDGALEDPPAARRFLDRMETEVDALGHMISELLELARIESGKVPLRLNYVHPCKLLITAYDRMHVQADRKKLNVRIDCDENLPDILADEVRMEQVIVNLFHNSIKFTPEGGEIILGAYEEFEMVIFFVKDNGVGIPTAELLRIFERFYKADRARSSGGTGLGLAISRHIVEAHGGNIWVESIETEGSKFFFSLKKN